MEQFWQQFIQEWSDEFFIYLSQEDEELYKKYETEEQALRRGSLGYPPATEKQIVEAEERLGFILPASYKAFLRVSNGLLIPYFDADHCNLLPVEKIGLLSEVCGMVYETLIKTSIPKVSEETYRIFTEEDDEIRTQDINKCIAISERVDCGIYVMNPGFSVIPEEYETCSYLFRAVSRRFPSFEVMMKEERIRCCSYLHE